MFTKTNFKEKRFRYGTFSTAMMLLAVVLFVVVNLVADEFNRSRDLTAEQLFTLTSQSRNFLENLDRDVTITHIAQTGHENAIISQLMEEYAAASRHVTIEMRDPLINPAIVHALAERAGMDGGIPDSSVVVQSSTDIRVITPSDMMTFDFNMWGQITGIRSFNFEAEITRALHFVTQGEPPIIYVVTGSEEMGIGPNLRTFLERENFIVRDVNLVVEEVPENADILIITMPSRDWAEIKADRILAFLEDEGRAFFAMHFSSTSFPNVDRVLAAYGIALGDYLVFEGNPRNILQLPHNVLPTISHHPIHTAAHERNFATLLQLPISLDVLDVRRVSLDIEPLMMTSREAFARVDPYEVSLVQVPSDISGPFVLAAAITDTRFIDRTLETRMVLVSSFAITNDEVDAFIGGGNSQFVLGSLNWLQGQPPGIFIPVRRPPGMAPLVMNQFQAAVLNGVAIVGLPLITIAAGVFVWFRRRHS